MSLMGVVFLLYCTVCTILLLLLYRCWCCDVPDGVGFCSLLYCTVLYCCCCIDARVVMSLMGAVFLLYCTLSTILLLLLYRC